MKFLSPDEGRALRLQAASFQHFQPGMVCRIKLALGFLVKLLGCYTITWSKGGGERRKAIKDGRKVLWEVVKLTSVFIKAAYQKMEEPPSSVAREQLLFPPHASTEQVAGQNQFSYGPLNTDQPLLTRGSQVSVLTPWEGRGAEMLLSAPWGFIN